MKIESNINIKPYNKKNIIAIVIVLLLGIVIYNGFSTPLPAGLAYEGEMREVSDIKFLYDLTYTKDGKRVTDHSIFDNQLQIIKEAKKFIILDLFLFNDDYDKTTNYPKLSSTLTETLIEQKKNNKDLKVYFITDEINNFYGAYESHYIKELKDNGINVIVTDLEKLKESNPIYSGVWSTFVKWFGTSGKGWVRNAFSKDSPDVTLRSYLRLLNFKANHRKIIITENAAIVSSSNPHDASGYHSNIAFKVKGDIIKDLIKAEDAVAAVSGVKFDGIEYVNSDTTKVSNTKISVITESKIKENLIEDIKSTNSGDEIKVGAFYLSEREIIKELLDASSRGVDIKVVLDANKDAFGVEKNGIPNRQVASELLKKSNDKIKIRWYDTHGEQFHTKLTYINSKDKAIIIGGSANLTRRNLEDYNLEANLRIETDKNSEIVKEIEKYFNRIWNNTDGNYTLDFDAYKENSWMKNIIYRFQEWSGLCTF